MPPDAPATPASVRPLRLVPIAALAAAAVLLPLALWGDRQLDGWIRGDAESRAEGPSARADAAYHDARVALLGATALLYLAIVGGAFAADRRFDRRIGRPAMTLATIAEAVASGDLGARLPPDEFPGDVEPLARAVAAMAAETARLGRGLAVAAPEMAAVSSNITARVEELGASAARTAAAVAALSGQSESMAGAARALAESAARLGPLAGLADAAARDGLKRNARLRTLALENRGRLDEGTSALDALTRDVESSAGAIAGLAGASQEIRSFVALVQKLARQSRMLALNAAMEAARAGDQGEGFAVVAAEVRRLSTMSSEAAEHTQRLVAEILAGVEASRTSAERTVATAREVRGVIEQGSTSFGQIELVVAELEQWTASMEHAAADTSAVVHDMAERLGELVRDAESVAASTREMASSSAQQNGAQAIAGAVASLARTATELSKLAEGLRVETTPRVSGSSARA